MFFALPWYWSTFLIIVLTGALTVLCIVLVRKLIPGPVLKKNHELAGYFLGIVGVLYSVLLGFTVINAQNRYNDLHQTVNNEAALLGDLYRDAGAFPEANRLEIRQNLKNYTESVINDEWAVEGMGMDCAITKEYSRKIWNSYFTFEPTTQRESIWYQDSISKLNDLNSTRLLRLFATKENLGRISWILLYFGTVLTISLMLFFAHDSIKAQIIMTASIAGYLAFILFLIHSLDNAFTSDLGIKPQALQEILRLFNEWK